MPFDVDVFERPARHRCRLPRGAGRTMPRCGSAIHSASTAR